MNHCTSTSSASLSTSAVMGVHETGAWAKTADKSLEHIGLFGNTKLSRDGLVITIRRSWISRIKANAFEDHAGCTEDKGNCRAGCLLLADGCFDVEGATAI